MIIKKCSKCGKAFKGTGKTGLCRSCAHKEKRPPLSKKHKRKLSLINKGKKHTEEVKRKISLAHKGKHFSTEHKEKLSLANKGKHHSEETRKKMRFTHRGKHLSKEIKQKLSIAHKGKKLSEQTKKKMSLSHKGKEISEKHRKNLSLAFKGEKHWNWQGGITPILNQIRNSLKYKEWHQNIFIRDDFNCQKCGVKGGNLHAHHIKSFSKLIEEVKQNLPLYPLYDGAMIYTPLWNLDNGITLCKKCHKR